MEQNERAQQLMEWTPFLSMEALDDQAIVADLEGRTLKTLVYEFPQDGGVVQGLSIKGVDAAAAAMANQGFAIREMGVDVVVDGDNAFFKAGVELYRIVTRPDGTVQEILLTRKLGVKRQGKLMKRKDSRMVDDPFWYEKGSTKAIRNAIARMIPENVRTEILHMAAQKGAISKITPPANRGGGDRGAQAARTGAQRQGAAPQGNGQSKPRDDWKPSVERGSKITAESPIWQRWLEIIPIGERLGLALVINNREKFQTGQPLLYNLEILVHSAETLIANAEPMADAPAAATDEADPPGEPEDGAGEEQQTFEDHEEYPTPEQIGEIEELVKASGQPMLVDPATEEAWIWEDTDLLVLTKADAERILTLLREQQS